MENNQNGGLMSSLLIKNGMIVTATDSFLGDIRICDGKIVSIGTNLETAEATTIEAEHLLIFPGGVDPHVHMELSVGGGLVSADDFESGTRAAIAGGTTTIIDFVTPTRGQSLLEALHERRLAAAKALCNTRLHMSVTEWNKTTASELQQCVQHEGLTSVKVYMAYKQSIGLDDRHIMKVMDTAAGLGMLVLVHCEFDEIIAYLQCQFLAAGLQAPLYHSLSRPPEVEREAVSRAILMAKVTACPLYIVHVSTMEAVAEIATAQQTGQKVWAETCPHYLLLDESRYHLPGFDGAKYVMSPPLRPAHHQKLLWDALNRGTLHTVATDHCPFFLKGQKERGKDNFTLIPSGVGGVEFRLMLLYSYGVAMNRLTLQQFVNITATQPAKIFGLYPKKGTIAVGADADVVLWDPQAQDTISASTQQQNCDTTIYEGFQIKGKPHMVIVNGEIAFRNGRVVLGSLNQPPS